MRLIPLLISALSLAISAQVFAKTTNLVALDTTTTHLYDTADSANGANLVPRELELRNSSLSRTVTFVDIDARSSIGHSSHTLTRYRDEANLDDSGPADVSVTKAAPVETANILLMVLIGISLTAFQLRRGQNYLANRRLTKEKVKGGFETAGATHTTTSVDAEDLRAAHNF